MKNQEQDEQCGYWEDKKNNKDKDHLETPTHRQWTKEERNANYRNKLFILKKVIIIV